MQDKKLVFAWKKKGNQEALNKLKVQSEKQINAAIYPYLSTSVPKPVLEAQGWILFNQALNNYNPRKGAAFSTHFFNRLKGIDRYVKAHQNIGYIPEAMALKIGALKAAEEELSRQKGRPATTQELAQQLKWAEPEIERLRKSLRADIHESGFLEVGQMNMRETAEKELLYDFINLLEPEEKIVYEYLVGINGKPKINRGGRIAKLTGFSQSKISLLRTSIANKLKPHLAKITF